MSEIDDEGASFDDLIKEQEDKETEEFLKELEVEGDESSSPVEEKTEEDPILSEALQKGYEKDNYLHGSPERFLEAVSIGYRSKAPEGTRAKSVDEYIETGVLIDKLKATADENREMKDTLKYLKSRFDKQDQEKVTNQYKQLEQERVEAVAEADVRKVFEIEQKQKELQESLKAPTEESKPEVAPEKIQAGQEFLSRNSYLTNGTAKAKEMLRFAVAYEETLFADFPNDKERLVEVERVLKKTYSDVFNPSNPARQEASKVVIPQEKRAVGESVATSYPGWTPQDELSYKYLRKEDPKYTREKYYNQVIKTR